MIKLICNAIAIALCFIVLTPTSAQESWVTSAYQYLEEKDKIFDLNISDFNDPIVTDTYTSMGISHFYYNQQWDGIPIYNKSMSVTVQDGVLKYASHNYISLDQYTKIPFTKIFDPNQILLRAAEFAGMDFKEDFVETELKSEFKIKGRSNISKEEIFIEKTYEIEKQTLVPGWLVGIFHDKDSKWIQYHINAESGELLSQSSWTIECSFDHDHCNDEHSISSHYKPIVKGEKETHELSTTVSGQNNYEVFAAPLFSPLFGERTIESTPWSQALNASPFGWHDDDGVVGAEYTTTRGNNVLASEDEDANNSAGYSPDGGSDLNFIFPFDENDAPQEYQEAAITNLFYWNNMMHDIFYQYGFDEASGNFQENNYGKGGFQSDMVYADAQDGSSTNNANFSTPPDGSNPRMQMFVWNVSESIELEVTQPASIAGTFFASGANFGPNSGTFSGELVQVEPNIACSNITNGSEINGNIAVIDRGTCTFISKVSEAQNAGAVAAIICNNVSGPTISMGGSDPGINIPSIFLTKEDCDLIKAQNPLVEVEFTLGDIVQRDSDMDNSVIAHEYGHGISIRLTGGPSTSNCLSGSEQMGEGWSDFLGLVTSIEMGDVGNDSKGVGAYLVDEPKSGNGIRTYPYSTDLTINQHTYDDIKTESVPHGVGTVWAIMLWEMTWELINAHGFDPDLYNGTGGNNKAMALVIEGMKLQPCGPGFVDARDAILAADDILYGGENKCLIWGAFAKRGLGVSATQGSSASRSDGTEAFDTPSSCQGDLTLTHTGNYIVSVGDTIDYSISSTNIGNNNASEINITNVIPNGLNYIQGSLSQGSETNGVIAVTEPQLTPNTTINVDYKVEVTELAQTSTIKIFQDFEYDYSDWNINSGQGSASFGYSSSFPYRGVGSFFVPNTEFQNSQFLTLENIDLNGPSIFVFNHHFITEHGKDGGLVEISLDEGATWNDLGSRMLENGYNGILEDGTNDDIDNRHAFTGVSGGYIRTLIDLSAYANRNVDIRFFFGSNDQVSSEGWYIDDIILYNGLSLTNTVCLTSLEGTPVCKDTKTIILPSCEMFNRYFEDLDNDGFGNESTSVLACEPVNSSTTDFSDCDDNNPNIYPGAPEICGDDIDQDCNNIIEDCPVSNCTIESDEDLEADLGIWIDGGEDCLRTINDAEYANSGVYCVRLRDNSSTSYIQSSTLNFSIYGSIQVGVSFISEGYAQGDQFFLEQSIDDGVTWTTVEVWNYLTDIINDTRYNEMISVMGPFTSTTILRFRNNASSNSKRVYLDDFYIEACLSDGPPSCFDGIQNQEETGIDCGGPNCSPCSADGCVTDYAFANMLTGTISTISDFETNGAIQSNQIIGTNAIIEYDSQSEVTLEIGFETQMGAQIEINIDGCNSGQ